MGGNVKILKDDHGISLIVVVMIMVLLLTMTGASLLFTSIHARSAANLRLGTTALHAADAGIRHAVAVIPKGLVFNYPAEGGSAPTIASGSIGGGYSYTVTAMNDPTSPGGNTRAILTSTGRGPGNTRKVVIAYVARGDTVEGDGTVFIPGRADTVETNFSGTSFLITGNDTNYDGTPGPATPKPGIVVTDPALQAEITNDTTSDGGLANNQMGNVTGAGGSPSVATVTPPELTPTQIADAFLQHPHTTLAGGTYAGQNEIWGTDLAPRITRVTGDLRITGNMTGSGVLIVDGTLDISGTVNFHGLIIARGPVQVDITGTVGIFGGIMLAEGAADRGYEFQVRGNARVYYSSQAYAMIRSRWSNAWPKPATIISWQEKLS
jgi:hypothetical protein